MKTLKAMEVKVQVEGIPLSDSDFKKLEEIQFQSEDIENDQEEKNLLLNLCFCFEGFCRHECLIFNCIGLLIFSLVISTLISMMLSAILLSAYGNIQQGNNQTRFLANGENKTIIPTEKRLQIISQNA
jgi:hypothetical protein